MARSRARSKPKAEVVEAAAVLTDDEVEFVEEFDAPAPVEEFVLDPVGVGFPEEVVVQVRDLTPEECAEMDRLEIVIAAGQQTFLEVGAALLVIREKCYYLRWYTSFEEYCRERWGFSRQHGLRLINAVEVLGDLGMTPAGVNGDTTTNGSASVLPTERQLRPLSELPPEERREAWEEAVEEAGGRMPTGPQVEDVVGKRKQKKDPRTANIPPGAQVQEIHVDGEEGLVEEDAPEELTDKEWLTTLPLMRELPPDTAEKFAVEALAYRHSEHFIKRCRDSIHNYTKGVHGPWVHRIQSFFRTDGPAKWIVCSNCGGQRTIPMIGKCPACYGFGYMTHGR